MAATAFAVLVLGACTSTTTTTSSSPAVRPTATVGRPVASTTTIRRVVTTQPTPATDAAGVAAARAELRSLRVDDRPHSLAGYSRSRFPQWLDVDGYGCDARDEVVIESSVVRPTVAHCKVTSGRWVSAYDGLTTTDPSTFDVDHVVPLADAWKSGAAAWSAAERTQYANQPFDLWLVSAASNRAKGDAAPDEWRPPNHAIWCEYAERWIAIKARWRLSVTTPERDALGQMLDTCGGASPTTVAPRAPTPAATGSAGSSVYYANCAAARAAGAAPILRGQPGYRSGLDRDDDGVACE
ncbi:MAG TPA: excalibur calcium-binding domain-containing protein [Acidimicrobiales bacterium]|nr:excalibur calcium-binding domain-containing protein [Acidimicrobiales bacterium]